MEGSKLCVGQGETGRTPSANGCPSCRDRERGRGLGRGHFIATCHTQPRTPQAPPLPRVRECREAASQEHLPAAARYLCFGEQSPEPPEGAATDGTAADPLEPVLCLHLGAGGRQTHYEWPHHHPAGLGEAVARGCPQTWVTVLLEATPGQAGAGPTSHGERTGHAARPEPPPARGPAPGQADTARAARARAASLTPQGPAPPSRWRLQNRH